MATCGKRVTERMNIQLIMPFSNMEVRDVVQNMSKSSCPGEDGFSITFFQQYWDVVGDRLRILCNHVLESGRMPQAMATGLIYMIPKGNNQAVEIEKWRPITLLNTIYKIYVKVLSMRIQKF